MRWGNMWQCEARLLYEAKRRALGTRYMVTFFFQFVSSPIVWFLAVKQNLSEPKLNLLLLCSRGRRTLKEGRVKRLLPQSWSGRIMNRKGSSWHDRHQLHTSVKYRRTIGEVSAKSRRSVGEVSVNEKLYRPRHIWNDYRPCLDRVSSDYRPSLDRLSTAISTESRPPINRLSTDYLPSVDRPSTAI